MIDCPVCGRDVSLQEYSYNDEMCVHCLKKVYPGWIPVHSGVCHQMQVSFRFPAGNKDSYFPAESWCVR